MYRRSNGGRSLLDESPVLFNMITGLRELGAIVELEGVAGTVGGLYLVSLVFVLLIYTGRRSCKLES